MRKIISLLFATGLLSLFFLPALADSPPRSGVQPRIASSAGVQNPTMTGAFYAGVLGSYDWESDALSAFTAGGLVGYHVRSANLGFGVEADATRRLENIRDVDEIDQWTFTARGRLGFYLTPERSSPFFYGTAGYAWQANEESLVWGGGLELYTTERTTVRAEVLRVENEFETTTARAALLFKF